MQAEINVHVIASTNIKTLLYSREIFISFDFDGINDPYTKLKYTYVSSTSTSMDHNACWAI